MKYNCLIVFVVFLVSCGTNSYEYPETAIVQGNPSAIFVKSVSAAFKENWETVQNMDDSLSRNYYNAYYDDDGTLLKTDYFRHDSTLIKTIEQDSWGSGREYNSEGELVARFELLKHLKDSLVACKYEVPSNQVVSKTYTYHEDGFILSQSHHDLFRNSIARFDYIRDENGLEIGRVWTMVFDNVEAWRDSTLNKYLNYDAYGNWTSQINYKEDSTNQCYLTTRNFEYY